MSRLPDFSLQAKSKREEKTISTENKEILYIFENGLVNCKNAKISIFKNVMCEVN